MQYVVTMIRNGNMLFDGGEFDINSPDAESVWTYECPMGKVHQVILTELD